MAMQENFLLTMLKCTVLPNIIAGIKHEEEMGISIYINRKRFTAQMIARKVADFDNADGSISIAFRKVKTG